jgi:gamma-glutamylcyclotransferase (GGCT)/AIG2-like uncharacterized protein YtfP
MRLIVYGTLRQGEALSRFLPRDGKREVMEISGLQLYVVGECPGAKLDTEGKITAELWELDLNKRKEKLLLYKLDLLEDVSEGLYKRNYIDISKGRTLVYTICGSVKGCPRIKDWKEWQKKSNEEKVRILIKSGGVKIEIQRSVNIWM